MTTGADRRMLPRFAWTDVGDVEYDAVAASAFHLPGKHDQKTHGREKRDWHGRWTRDGDVDARFQGFDGWKNTRLIDDLKREYGRLAGEYPSLRDYAVHGTFADSARGDQARRDGAVAFTSRSERIIALDERTFGTPALADVEHAKLRDQMKPFAPGAYHVAPVDDAKIPVRTMTHEVGHALWNQATDAQRVQLWGDVREYMLKHHSHDAAGIPGSVLDPAHFDDPELAADDIMRLWGGPFGRSEVGTVGATDHLELVAEAFAEYKLSSHPRPFARLVGRWYDATLGQGQVIDVEKGTGGRSTPVTLGDNVYTSDRALVGDIAQVLKNGIFQAPYADYEDEARLVTKDGHQWANPVTVYETPIASQCHSLTAFVTKEEPRRYRHAFGWARNGDVWVMHSWLSDTETGGIVEVTPIVRDEYFGVELTPAQAKSFRRKMGYR